MRDIVFYKLLLSVWQILSGILHVRKIKKIYSGIMVSYKMLVEEDVMGFEYEDIKCFFLIFIFIKCACKGDKGVRSSRKEYNHKINIGNWFSFEKKVSRILQCYEKYWLFKVKFCNQIVS